MGEYRFKLPDIGEGVVEAEITAWHVAVGDTVEEDAPIADAMTDKASTYAYKLPDIGEGVVEAEITAWHVSIGDDVEEDAPIADAMTDKATIELTSPVSGTVKIVACEEGAIVPSKPKAKSTPPPSMAKSAKTPASKSDKVLAAPAVRKAAKEKGLNLSNAKATGKDGEVTHADLALLEKSFAQEDGETRIKVIGLRRVIAQRMQEAKRHIPHFTYVEEIDVTELEALRKRANEKKNEDKPKLTVLPFIIRALAKTLEDWPQFNARYMDEQGYVSQFSDLNLGIAAQTDAGLIVPVLKKAQTLSIWQMAEEIGRLAEGARTNKLGTEDLTGATTTLTSLGPLGGIVTTPVINRPEVAIFGPNKIRKKLFLEEGDIAERLVMNFSVSCDHRVIDGYDAAKMMQDMKHALEDPLFMFLS